VDDPFPDPRRARRGRDRSPDEGRGRGRSGGRGRRDKGRDDQTGRGAGDGWADVVPSGSSGPVPAPDLDAPRQLPPMPPMPPMPGAGRSDPPPAGGEGRRRRREQPLDWLDKASPAAAPPLTPPSMPPMPPATRSMPSMPPAVPRTPPAGSPGPPADQPPTRRSGRRRAEPPADEPFALRSPPPPGGGPFGRRPASPLPPGPIERGGPGFDDDRGPGAAAGAGPAMTPPGGFAFPVPDTRRETFPGSNGRDVARQGAAPGTPLPPMPPQNRRGRRAPEPAGPVEPVDEEPAAPPSRQGLIVLTLVALALVAWAATCLVDVADPYVSAASALSPAITVLAIPVVALGVGRRHPLPAALATLAAAVPWVLVAGYGAPGPGPTTPQAGAPVRIMTVNANDGRADAARITQLAQDNTADVVVITELTSALAHDLTVAGLNNLVTPRSVEFEDTGGDGIGIWTAGDFDDARRLSGLSRPAVSGVLSTATGDVGVVAAHAAGRSITPGSGWQQDLAALPGLVPDAEGGRGIIIGDFNATPWSPAFRRLASGEWRDAADVVGRGLRPTWPSWTPLPISPLDHVLVSEGLGVSGVNSADVEGSGHRALIVTVVVPPKQT
jgi:endonuclease/exonuclease/phosphatase (EEP) superfamily protein YafD